MSRSIRYPLVILTTLAALLLLWKFHSAGLLFVISLAVAAAMRPLVKSLVALRLPRGLALPLAYLLVLGILGELLFRISGPLFQDLQTAVNDFLAFYDQIKTGWPETGNTLQRLLAQQLPARQDLNALLIDSQGTLIAQTLFGVASNLFDFFSNISIIIILSIYWSADAAHFEQIWLSLLPARARTAARTTWRDVEYNLGAYLQSQILQSLLAGLLLGLIYWIIGLKYAALLALAAALFRLIPWFGILLAIIPPLLVGLTPQPLQGILAGAFAGMVLIAVESLVRLRFFTHQRYSSLLLVLVAIALTDFLGLPGLILAPAVAVTLQILIGHLLPIHNEPAADSTTPKLTELHHRFTEIRPGIDSPEMVNLADRLDELLEKTREFHPF